MDIEMMPENMIGSISTQDSKNMHLSNDSNFNLINLNFANSHIIPSTNPNMLLYEEQKMDIENDQCPEKSKDQEPVQNPLAQPPIPNPINQQLPEEGKNLVNNDKKKIFDFQFSSNVEYISFIGEYLNDIYSNLLEDEKNLKFKPNPEYMNQQGDINMIMRSILIDWLVDVHLKFQFKEETLYQTIWIIDTYLSKVSIQKTKLQLVGTAALFISCKKNEIYYPRLSNFIEIVDNAYDKEELVKMENDILMKLEFNIISPSALDFYNIISKAFKFDLKQYLLGKYFLESSLLDYQLLRYAPSVIGISCVYISMKFFGFPNYKDLYSKDMSNAEEPQKMIKDAARDICFFVKNLHNSKWKAVKNKYSLPENLNIAHYCDTQES